MRCGTLSTCVTTTGLFGLAPGPARSGHVIPGSPHNPAPYWPPGPWVFGRLEQAAEGASGVASQDAYAGHALADLPGLPDGEPGHAQRTGTPARLAAARI